MYVKFELHGLCGDYILIIFFKFHIFVHLFLKDVSDLFGADLPVEGAGSICFEWRDGPFLKALKNGDWIVLDEVCPSEISQVCYLPSGDDIPCCVLLTDELGIPVGTGGLECLLGS